MFITVSFAIVQKSLMGSYDGSTWNLTGKGFFENVLRNDRYEVLARKAPQVADYSQGLSRASTCVSLSRDAG